MHVKRPVPGFWFFFIGSWVAYFFLFFVINFFKLYEWFPGVAFFGYALIIVLQLIAINYSHKRHHYIVLSASLIFIGAIASLDMILHKQQMAELWVLWDWFPLTPDHIEGYLQVLIILLNIFTGSIAAQCLFYGLNKRSFDAGQE